MLAVSWPKPVSRVPLASGPGVAGQGQQGDGGARLAGQRGQAGEAGRAQRVAPVQLKAGAIDAPDAGRVAGAEGGEGASDRCIRETGAEEEGVGAGATGEEVRAAAVQLVAAAMHGDGGVAASGVDNQLRLWAATLMLSVSNRTARRRAIGLYRRSLAPPYFTRPRQPQGTWEVPKRRSSGKT